MLTSIDFAGKSKVFRTPTNADEYYIVAVDGLLVLMKGSKLIDNACISSLRYSADINLSPNIGFQWQM